MKIITHAWREFIAGIIADLGKTFVGIGLASYFFERFPFSFRLILSAVGPVALIWSIFIRPKEK